MSFSNFNHVRVTALAAVVPQNEIRLDDEVAYYNNDMRKVQRVKKMLGLDRRRISPDGVTASDLCTQAAEHLFSQVNTPPASIDALIFVTQSADYPVPASAFLQQKSLGLPVTCAAFDVNLGCSGYVYGLWLASCMIESGARQRVLLLVGDSGCREYDPANRIVTPIFGDAGTATLLEYEKNAAPLSFSLGSDGRGYEAIIRPGGGARIPHLLNMAYSDGYLDVVRDLNDNPWTVGGFCNTWMDGAAVFDFTMSVIPEHIRGHLAHLDLIPSQLDRLILHQANKQIIHSIAAATGFSLDQTPWETLGKFGNQSCASIPCVICDQLKADCDAEKGLHLMLCGYGIGLSWASCIGNFARMTCCGVHDFISQTTPRSREEEISYWHTKFAGK